jgi:hypothetical protein
VREAEIVLTMLPAGRHVLSAYQGSDDAEGLLAAARPGAVFIDSSTIDVADARAAASAAVAAGHRALVKQVPDSGSERKLDPVGQHPRAGHRRQRRGGRPEHRRPGRHRADRPRKS